MAKRFVVFINREQLLYCRITISLTSFLKTFEISWDLNKGRTIGYELNGVGFLL